MRRMLFAALAGACLATTVPARAEVYDMASITCGDLVSMSDDDIAFMLFWLHGYFGGLAHDTKLDLKGLEAAAHRLGAYCAKHRNVTLITAVKDI